MPNAANVIADTAGSARPTTRFVVGAHLDSVLGGPGIQDNGSGSAAILEIAEQMAKAETNNHVRFIWFSAEESGLLGSRHYVTTLPEDELGDIAAMLNFDMIASPNFARFVYDGSDPTAPTGSGAIEGFFNGWFGARGLAYEPTLDQMSDAAAAATITYAQNTTSINGVEGKGNFKPPKPPKGAVAIGAR